LANRVKSNDIADLKSIINKSMALSQALETSFGIDRPNLV